MQLEITIGDAAITAAFVALLIAGSASAFLLYEGWTSANPDEREVDRAYSFEGICDGEQCVGTGESKFIGFRGGYRLYTLDVEFDSGGISHEASLNLIFDEHDRLDSTLYTLIAEDDSDGGAVSVWTRSENGIDYTLHVSDNCLLKSITLSSAHFRLTGVVIR